MKTSRALYMAFAAQAASEHIRSARILDGMRCGQACKCKPVRRHLRRTGETVHSKNCEAIGEIADTKRALAKEILKNAAKENPAAQAIARANAAVEAAYTKYKETIWHL